MTNIDAAVVVCTKHQQFGPIKRNKSIKRMFLTLKNFYLVPNPTVSDHKFN